METILIEYNAKNKIAKGMLWILSKVSTTKKITQPPKRKRIPVEEIYFKNGDYKELVEDPFNLKK